MASRPSGGLRRVTAIHGAVLGAVGFWVLSILGAVGLPQERWGGCSVRRIEVSVFGVEERRAASQTSTPVSPATRGRRRGF